MHETRGGPLAPESGSPTAGVAVVAAVDGSQSSERALEWAAGEARRRGQALRVVHVFRADDPVGVGTDPEILLEARHVVDQAADRARTLVAGTVAVHALAIDSRPPGVVADGRPTSVLVDQSQNASLLVLGSRGRGGFATVLLGSTAVEVAARTACPVAVVSPDRTTTHARTGPVVVGVDASAGASRALAFAFRRAAARGSPLVVVHACKPPGARQAHAAARLWRTGSDRAARAAYAGVERVVTAWRARYPQVPVQLDAISGHPVPVIAQACRPDTDVAVVGSRGCSALTGAVLGSVSHGLLRHAVCCPVVVTR